MSTENTTESDVMFGQWNESPLDSRDTEASRGLLDRKEVLGGEFCLRRLR